MTTRTVTATDFYRRPGEELERVARDREPLVVLRRGVPLVRVEPVDREGNPLRGKVEYTLKPYGPHMTDPYPSEKGGGALVYRGRAAAEEEVAGEPSDPLDDPEPKALAHQALEREKVMVGAFLVNDGVEP